MKTPKIEIRISKKEDYFVLIEASKLSLQDKFMKYKPVTEYEKELKAFLEQSIKGGTKDFYCQRIDPSIRENGQIYYELGQKPGVGKSFNWWQYAAERFWPERHSRLGFEREYKLFQGMLIKQLVDSGWRVKKAWNAVCEDSEDLGHYENSKKAKYTFEPTGSRQVLEFFDLANTIKYLADEKDTDSFYVASGHYFDCSYLAPTSYTIKFKSNESCNKYAVGWIVLPI